MDKKKKQITIVTVISIVSIILAISFISQFATKAMLDEKIITTEIKSEDIPKTIHDLFMDKVEDRGTYIEKGNNEEQYVLLTYGNVIGLDMNVSYQISNDSILFKTNSIFSADKEDKDSKPVYKIYKTNAKEILFDNSNIQNPYLQVKDTFQGVNEGYIKEAADSYLFIVPIRDDLDDYRRFIPSTDEKYNRGLIRYKYQKDKNNDFPIINNLEYIDTIIKKGTVTSINLEQCILTLQIDSGIKLDLKYDEALDMTEKIIGKDIMANIEYTDDELHIKKMKTIL